MDKSPKVKAAKKPRKSPRKKPRKPIASRPPGRPSEYVADYDRIAENFALLGATDAELAIALDVSEQTLNAWKLRHPSFLEALKRGKEEADARVVKALFHRAIGYEHPAVKILTVAQGDGQGSVVEQVEYTERYPPDTTAGIFWLKNRQSKAWRDKQDHSHALSDSLEALLAKAHGAADDTPPTP